MNALLQRLALLASLLLAVSPAGRGHASDAGGCLAKAFASPTAAADGLVPLHQAAAHPDQHGVHWWDATVPGKPAPPWVPALLDQPILSFREPGAPPAAERPRPMLTNGRRLHALNCVWRC